MIKIIVNGSPLELLPDTTITLFFKSPIFNAEGTYSLPIRIANSINNKSILNFPSRIQNINNRPITYDCEIQANSFRLKGMLVVNTTGDYIEAYYTDGIGHFNYLAEGKYLTDINDDDATVFAGVNPMFDYLFHTIDYSYPDRNFVCFPSVNLALFDKTREEDFFRNYIQGIINEFDYQNVQFSDFLNEYDMPHFYLNYLLDKIFGFFGFHVGDNALYNNTQLRQLVLMSDFYKNRSYVSRVSWEAGYYKFNPAWYVPRYPVKSLISDLRNMFFCEFFINNRSQMVDIKLMKDILNSYTFEDISSKADRRYKIDFDEIEDGYKIGYNFNSTDTLLTSVHDITQCKRIADVNLVGDLPVYPIYNSEHDGEICLVRSLNQFYILVFTTTYSWRYYCDNLAESLNGSGELSRLSDSVPPLMRIKNNWLMPHMEFQGLDVDDHPYKAEGAFNNYISDKTLAQNTPKILFWHGRLPGLPSYPTVNRFPFASPDFYYRDQMGNYIQIAGKNTSLYFTGEGNLVQRFGTEYLHWWFNVRKTTRWKINWLTIDLHNLDFSKKYRINNQNYLVNSVEVSINSNGNLEVGETILELT